MVTKRPFRYCAGILVMAGLCALLLVALASFNALADGDANVSVSGADSKDAQPGEKVAYELNIENRGDSDDFDISLVYDDPDGGWSVESSDHSLRVSANSSKTFVVYVTPHTDDSTPEDGEILDVEMEVIARTGGAQDSAKVHTTCDHYYGAKFTTGSQTLYAEPDYDAKDILVFNITLTNTGDDTDDFRCELVKEYTDEDIQNWAQINKGAVITDLDYDSSAQIEIEITVRPYDQDHTATPGPKHFFFLAYSKGARDNGREIVNETTSLFTATVDVQEYYHVTVDSLDSNVPKLQGGDNASFEIKVQNLGNVQDTISMMSLGDAPTSGKYSTWQSFDKTPLTIDLDTSKTVNMTITVKADDDAPTGSYSFYYNAKSLGGDSVESEKKYNTIEFEETFGVEMEVPTHNLNVKPGEAAAFPIEITNTGNSEMEMNLHKPAMPLEDWEFYWSTSSSSSTGVTTTGNIDVDETKTMYLRVINSEDNARSQAGQYTIPFKVSTEGGGEDRVYAWDNVTVTIKSVFGLDVSTTIDHGEIAPGENTSYTVRLENQGNDWDNFTYEIIDSQQFKWMSLDLENIKINSELDHNGYNSNTHEITLETGAFVNVPFIVDVPAYSNDEDDAEAGTNYEVDVQFTSRGDSAKNRKQRLTTTIEQVYGVELTSKNNHKEVELRESDHSYVEFIVELKNLGNGDDNFTFNTAPGALEGEMGGWELVFKKERSVLNSSGFLLATLSKQEITVEVGADDSTKAGIYELDIDVSSKGDTDVKETITLILDCRKANSGVQFRSVNDKNQWNQTANPADMPRDGIEYRFKVKNIGEQEDSFLLKVETNTGSGTYRDWEILFYTEFGPAAQMLVPMEVPGSGGQEFLDEDEEIEIRVFVTPPKDEESSGNDLDKFGDMEISAESVQDNQQTDNIFFRLTIIRPDLKIDSNDISLVTTGWIEEGDTVDLEVTIHNGGEAESDNFDVWVYCNKENSVSGVGGTLGISGLIAHEKDVEGIDPRSEFTLDIDWEIEWGEHELYVYVDKPIRSGPDATDDKEKGDVIEESERNNDAKIGMDPLTGDPYSDYIDLRPWMEVKQLDLDGDLARGREVIITVTIYNNDSHMPVAGYGSADDDPSMFVRCRVGNHYLAALLEQDPVDNGYKVIPELEPGDTLNIQFKWTITEEPGDWVNIRVYLDYGENKNPATNTMTTIDLNDPVNGDEGGGGETPWFELGLLVLALCSALVLGKRKWT